MFLYSFGQAFRFQADAVEKRLQQLLQVVRTIFESAHRSVGAIGGATGKNQSRRLCPILECVKECIPSFLEVIDFEIDSGMLNDATECAQVEFDT